LKTFKGKDEDREGKGKERDERRKVKLKFKVYLKRSVKCQSGKSTNDQNCVKSHDQSAKFLLKVESFNILKNWQVDCCC
jgi:hypothetical protein